MGAHRNRTLDGIRGCLAIVVMTHHALWSIGYAFMSLPASYAVLGFFTISGCVLTKAWDGRYGAFLMRRVIRLWPLYALCLSAGWALSGIAFPFSLFVWLPICSPVSGPAANPPIWSLTVEAWAMLAMPAFVWVGRRSFLWLIAALEAAVLLQSLPAYMTTFFFCLFFFFLGAWISRFEIRVSLFESRIPQWLGRISFPLYLCHDPIITFLGLPLIVSVPLSFGVAVILTETVEKWSISASRRIGRLAWQDISAKSVARAVRLNFGGRMVGAVGIEPTTPPV